MNKIPFFNGTQQDKKKIYFLPYLQPLEICDKIANLLGLDENMPLDQGLAILTESIATLEIQERE